MTRIENTVTNLFVRLVYGLALVDFLTVIQFISAPQFQADWKAIWVSTGPALTGMLLLCVNIPLSFAWAMYADYLTKTGSHLSSLAFFVLPFLCTIGVLGIGFTLTSFSSFFGHVFLYAAIVAALFFVLAILRRPPKARKSN
jgi:hypothetical protein